MSEFKRALSVAELPDGAMKTIDVEGKSVLVVNIGGTYFAMGGVCNHEEWDLSEGSLSGTKLTCAGHGAVWDLRTGKAEFDEPVADEPLYEVKAENGFLQVRVKR